MYELRARRFEEDLVSTGAVEAFGDVINGVRATRFADRENGLYRGIGGLIGDGSVSVLQYETTELAIFFPDTNYINYEKALTGAVALVHDDAQLTTRNGTATVSRQGNFEVNFLPRKRTVRGIAVSLTVDALDRFLTAGGEERAGDVKYVVVKDSGPDGPDGALLGLTGHVLKYFEDFDHLAGRRAGRLVEALLVEIYVGFLREIGSLTLQVARPDTRADVVRRAEEFVHAHYNRPLTIADIAASADTNLRSLEAAFKDRKGMTPRQYLASIRLQRAHEMLVASPWSPITVIALECGFTHLGRFGQAYKSRYGKLPSETARRRRNGS